MIVEWIVLFRGNPFLDMGLRVVNLRNSLRKVVHFHNYMYCNYKKIKGDHYGENCNAAIKSI